MSEEIGLIAVAARFGHEQNGSRLGPLAVFHFCVGRRRDALMAMPLLLSSGCAILQKCKM
jgi:hypothetical protein